MFKKLLLVFVLISTFSGCIFDNAQNTSQTKTNSTNTVFSAFNDKHYIWENFNVTTNKAEGFN